MDEMTKKCIRCKETKAIGLFGNREKNSDGKQNYCKKCEKDYRNKNKHKAKAYREANKEHIAEKQKEYYKKNIEKRSTYAKEYRDNNKERIAEYGVQYRVLNLDKAKEYKAAWHIENKDKVCLRSREYYKNNKQHVKEYNQEYHSDNREEILKKQKKYREDNKESIMKYREDNKEKLKESCKISNQKNKGRVNAYNSKRRAAKLERTVAWADYEAIKDVYADCEEINLAARTAGSTERFVVDHEIPLQGELVSGLHVHTNLDIILESENASKGNKFTPGPHL